MSDEKSETPGFSSGQVPDASWPDKPANIPRSGSRIVRTGVIVLIGGICATAVGAGLLGQEMSSLESLGDFIHRSGMFSMLAALAILLVGYRWPVIKDLWQRIQEFQSMSHPAIGNKNSPETEGALLATEPALRPNPVIVLFGLLILLIFAALAGGLLFATPQSFAVYLVLWVNVAALTILTVTLVYGRGFLRTFCIGALCAIAMEVLSAGSTRLIMMSQNTVWGGGYGRNVDLEWRILVVIQWSLVLGMGLLGICVRLFLEISQLAPRSKSGTPVR